MKAVEIATKAAEIVGGDRQKTHGDKVKNHAAIAQVWAGYFRARAISGKYYEIGAEDVANLMELMKVARRLNGDFNPDDYIDGAGYAACAGEIASLRAGG